METVLKGQNALLQRIDHMEGSQRKLKSSLVGYGSRLLVFKAMTSAERKRHEKEITQLLSLKSSTDALYDIIREVLVGASFWNSL